MNNLGAVFYEIENFEEAIDRFQRFLHNSPSFLKNNQVGLTYRNELQVARFVLLVICGGEFTLIWTILEKWKKMGIGCSQLVNYSFLRKK